MKQYQTIIIRSFSYASILTGLALVLFILNIILNIESLNLIGSLSQLKNLDFAVPVVVVIFYYQIIFSGLFIIAFLIRSYSEQYLKKQISVWVFVSVILALLLIRSIISEPYLYQAYYRTIPPFAWIMDGLLFFDIRWLLDSLLFAIALAITFILPRRFILLFAGIATIFALPAPQTSAPDGGGNAETVIIIMADSLRKDIIDQDKTLFLHGLFNDSTVVENMYTVFPASVPTLAGIFSNQYPYKSGATAISLDSPLDTSFVKSLKEEYQLSIHTDFTDDDAVNRNNFNIPFDEIQAPFIDLKTNAYASVLTKNIILMAVINNAKIRNMLMPQLYQADTNANSDNTVQKTLKYLDQHRIEKKVAFVSMGDTHIPFRAIYPYYRPYLTLQEGKRFSWEFDYTDFTYHGESPADNQNIRNLYSMSVRKLDDHVEDLINGLKRKKLMQNTTIVVLSDQGENLFDKDLDLYSHNNLDTKLVINVPFAIFREDREQKIVTEGNYSLIDTLKIALNPEDILSYARSGIYIEADLDVHNPNNPLYLTRSTEIINTKDINNIKIVDDPALQRYKKRAVLTEDYILIYDPIKKPPYALYHLPTDPLFQTDQQENQPAIFSALMHKLKEFTDDAVAEKNY